jgi:hypothetical protein
MSISVPSRLVPNAPGLPGRIVTFAATAPPLGASKAGLAMNVSLTPDKPGASREREPHTGQAGSIVRREVGTKPDQTNWPRKAQIERDNRRANATPLAKGEPAIRDKKAVAECLSGAIGNQSVGW